MSQSITDDVSLHYKIQLKSSAGMDIAGRFGFVEQYQVLEPEGLVLTVLYVLAVLAVLMVLVGILKGAEPHFLPIT